MNILDYIDAYAPIVAMVSLLFTAAYLVLRKIERKWERNSKKAR